MSEIESAIIQSQDEPVLVKKDKGNKILFLAIILVAALIVGISLFAFQYGSKSSSVEDSLKKETQLQPSPTPFPFQELTIPYLRSRTYKSSLGELAPNSQNESYSSYLTSYQSDGLKIYGQLTVPMGEKPKDGWPAIIFVHGYIPPKNYQTFVNYSSYVDYLARSGFVIFKIDLRGHGNSEGQPGGGYYSGDYVVDVLNARAALQNSDFVAHNKIGLWGHSMAGNVVARAMTAAPGIPAIAIWAGAVYTYTDLGEFMIDDNSYQPPREDSPSRKKRNEMFEKYGRFDPNSDFWKQVPMTNYLDEIKGAISLNHAIDDPVVNVGYSRNLNNLLDKTSIVHELNEYPIGGHNFTGNTFNSAMQKTVEFFRKNLK